MRARPLLPWRVLISLLSTRCASILMFHDSSHARGNRSLSSRCSPNLAIFFDGSKYASNIKCNALNLHVAGDKGESKAEHGDAHDCESNIPVMHKLAQEAAAKGDLAEEGAAEKNCGQLAKYFDGVGVDSKDNFKTGLGTWRRALEAYEWLSEQYSGNNKIFVYGASRGGLSARMLQGLIHKFGLARGKEAAKTITNMSPFQCASSAKKDVEELREKSWDQAEIAHMGLMDAVLRTLNSWTEHWNIKKLGMRMTTTVKAVSVALALDDPRMVYESHELRMPTETKVEQVWFNGQHRDVMGGFPMSGLARISAGWMLDSAVKYGLLLPAKWREKDEMKADYMEYSGHMAGFGASAHIFFGGALTLETHFRHAKVKNPNECQEKGRPVQFHQSVKDRMLKNDGYVPQPFCCKDVKKGSYDLENIRYVSNEHYDYWTESGKLSDNPAWIKVTFGHLTGIETTFSHDLHLRVTSWSDKKVKKGRISAYKGHSSVVVHKSKKERKGDDQDFSNEHAVIIPRLYATTRLIVEVEQDLSGVLNHYIGRVEIRLDKAAGKVDELRRYPVRAEPSGKEGEEGEEIGSLEAKVETLKTDAEAAAAMENKDEPAQCQWLLKHSGLRWHELCHNTASSLPRILGIRAKGSTCQDFIKETTHGNSSQTREKEDWHKDRDASDRDKKERYLTE